MANSNCQEMGETRDPMAQDCLQDALRIANLYEFVGKDFWIMFAAKPDQRRDKAAIMGWEVTFTKPQAPIPGVLVWHVDSKKKEMNLDTKLSLPYDIPLFEGELSTSSKDIVPSLAETAKKSGSILLA